MNSRFELNTQMEAKLKDAGIPFETVKVFGAVRVNVHVTCVSADAASRWVQLLTRVFGKAPTATHHRWHAKVQKGTCLLPTMRDGYLVALVGA